MSKGLAVADVRYECMPMEQAVALASANVCSTTFTSREQTVRFRPQRAHFGRLSDVGRFSEADIRSVHAFGMCHEPTLALAFGAAASRLGPRRSRCCQPTTTRSRRDGALSPPLASTGGKRWGRASSRLPTCRRTMRATWAGWRTLRHRSGSAGRPRQVQTRRTVENAHWSDTLDWLTDTPLGPVFWDRSADPREGGLHAL
jgi:hypothetical protein